MAVHVLNSMPPLIQVGISTNRPRQSRGLVLDLISNQDGDRGELDRRGGETGTHSDSSMNLNRQDAKDAKESQGNDLQGIVLPRPEYSASGLLGVLGVLGGRSEDDWSRLPATIPGREEKSRFSVGQDPCDAIQYLFDIRVEKARDGFRDRPRG